MQLRFIHSEVRKVTWEREKARWGSSCRTVDKGMCSLQGGHTDQGPEGGHFKGVLT